MVKHKLLTGFFLAGTCAFVSVAAADGGRLRGSIKDAPAAAPSYNWSGAYVGVLAGYGWGESAVRKSFDSSPTSYFIGDPDTPARFSAAGSRDIEDNGFSGGIQIGYNFQSGPIVLGVEGDLSYLGFKASRTTRVEYITPPVGNGIDMSDRVEADYLATLRARLGFASANFLAYVTAGLAFTDLKHTHRTDEWGFDALPACAPTSSNFCDLGAKSSGFKTGWTIGGGGEVAISRNWLLKAEYLYVDLGKVSSATAIYENAPPLTLQANSGIAHSADLTLHLARMGLSYKF